MNKLLLTCLIVFTSTVLWAQVLPDANGVIYVKAGATGNGSSWANALPQLADALKFAKTNIQVTQIWVAGGTYKPLYSPADNNFGNAATVNNSFLLVKDVKVYGGFAGTETTLAGRDLTLTANRTILSGDLDNNDVLTTGISTTINGNNANHLVISAGDVGTAALNGFTITGGGTTGTLQTIVVNSKTINNNEGGGIYNMESSPSFSQLNISGNQAVKGGAIADHGSYLFVSKIKLSHSIFSANKATDKGGAIYALDCKPIINNVIVSGNRAAEGGGMYSDGNYCEPVLINVTISGNAATNGGGCYRSSGSLYVKNSIIYGNSATSGKDLYGNMSGSNSIVNWTNGYSVPDPFFVNPKDASTAPFLGGDYRLKYGSPGMNRGSNTFYAAAQTPDLSDVTTDLDGKPRFFGGQVDIGAYENTFQPQTTNNVLYVKKGGTGNGSSWASALGEFSDALLWANIALADNAAAWATTPLQIWVAGGTYKPLHRPDSLFLTKQSRNQAFLMVKDVKIYGGFAGTESSLVNRNLKLTANRSILSGDLDDNDGLTDGISTSINGNNAAHLMFAIGDVGKAELNGFILTGGNTLGQNANVTIKTKSIYYKAAGGIYCDASNPILNNLTISGNKAENGAGMYIIGYPSPILTNVSIIGNSASFAGGGVYESASSTIMTNVIISDNIATQFGGGISSLNTQAIYTNVTISNNKTSSVGGGMLVTGGAPKMNNSIMWNNKLMNGTTASNLYVEGGGTPVIKYSLVEGLTSTTDGNVSATGITTAQVFNDADGGDYRLKSASPALNAGSSAFYTSGLTPDLSTILTDLANKPRVRGTAIDMGAYENAVMLPSNNVLYVKKNGTGDGSSWENAIGELADVLVWANDNKIDSAAKWATTPLQIFVAGGTYKPLYSSQDGANFGTPQGQNNAFLVVNNVKLYGGFAGTESALANRNLKLTANSTILSGDLDDNDGLTSGISTTINGSNAFHVIVSAGEVGTAQLNGFTITGGGTTGTLQTFTTNGKTIYNNFGGGLYNFDSAPVLSNLILSGNQAVIGGAIGNFGTPKFNLNNTIISGNKATNLGGGIYNFISSPLLTNLVINGNTATNNGGGIYNYYSTPSLTNITISANSATTAGSIANDNSNTKIRNSIIYGNSSGIVNVSSTPVISYSLVQGVAADATNHNVDGATNPMFMSTTDYTLQTGSAAINTGNDIFYASAQTPDLTSITTDLAGKPRINGTVDMGAYEYEGPLPVTLLSYTAKAETAGARLNWQTATELNNEFFTISSSKDGVNFSNIGRLNSKDNSNSFGNYTFLDLSAKTGQYYYRLQQTDKDGKVTDLGIRTVNMGLNKAEVMVYPNPASAIAYVKFASAWYEQAALIDLTGKILQTQTVKKDQSEVRFELGRLSPATYLIRLSGNRGSVTKPLIIISGR